MKKKIFLIIFIALLIISVTELFSIIGPSVLRTIFSSRYPAYRPGQMISGVINTATPTQDTKGGLNKGVFDALTNYKSEIIKSATIVLECTGTIEKIYAGPYEDQGVQYQSGFKMKDYSAFMCQYFDFTQEHLETMKVYDESSGDRKEISFNELKEGDRIKYTNIVDLTKDDSQASKIYNITITRE